MRPAGLFLLVPAGIAWVAAAGETAGLVSKATKSHVCEGLPAFQPKPAAKTEDETAAPDSPPANDPNLLVLPKLTVKGKRLPSDAADYLGNPKNLKRKMENIYLDEVAAVGRLNYFLNCFTIPILSPSKAERGKAIYMQRELQRLNNVAALPLPPPEKK